MEKNQKKKIKILFTIFFVITFLCAAWFTTAFVVRHKINNFNLHFITDGINWQPVESIKITGFPFNFITVLKDQKLGIKLNDKEIDLQFPEVKIKSNLFLTKNEIDWGKQFSTFHEGTNVLMSSSDHIKMKLNFKASPFFNIIEDIKDFHDKVSLFGVAINNFSFTFDDITDIFLEKINLSFFDSVIEEQKTKKIILDIVGKDDILTLNSNAEYYKIGEVIKFVLYNFSNKSKESSFSIKGKGSLGPDYEPVGDFVIKLNNIEQIASNLITTDELYKAYPNSKEVMQDIFDIIAYIENSTNGKIKIKIDQDQLQINEMSTQDFIDSIPDLNEKIDSLRQNIMESFSTLNDMQMDNTEDSDGQN